MSGNTQGEYTSKRAALMLEAAKFIREHHDTKRANVLTAQLFTAAHHTEMRDKADTLSEPVALAQLLVARAAQDFRDAFAEHEAARKDHAPELLESYTELDHAVAAWKAATNAFLANVQQNAEAR